jgi:uncharacterized protein YjbI with pentapeptide repeats
MMINKNMMNVFILLLTLTFISTPVFAKSTEKQSTSWWRVPYYHLIKVSKNIEKQIAELQRKANKLEKRKSKLEEKVKILEDEIYSLQERQNSLNITDFNTERVNTNSKTKITACPRCWFGGIDDLEYTDLSGAYLRGSMFNDAILNHTNFSLSNLRESSFYGAQLDGVNFSGANLSDADFTGAFLFNITWSAAGFDTTCPNGDIVSNGGSCEGHF